MLTDTRTCTWGDTQKACLLVAVGPLLPRGRASLRRPVAPVLLALPLLVAGVLGRGSLGRAWGQSGREATWQSQHSESTHTHPRRVP